VGRKDDKEDVSSYWMTLREKLVLEFERGSTRSHSLVNSLWLRLWTCQRNNTMNE